MLNSYGFQRCLFVLLTVLCAGLSMLAGPVSHTHAKASTATIAGTEYALPVAHPEYYLFRDPNNTQYHLWIPAGVTSVRGLIVVPDYYDDYNIYTSDTLGYRQLAQKLNFGLLQYFALNVDLSDKPALQAATNDLIDNVLSSFAQLSGHPEVAYANVLPMGLSWGGQSAAQIVWGRPERTIGYVSFHASDDISSNPATVRVPAIIEDAQHDEYIDVQYDDSIPLAEAQNANGGVQTAYIKHNTVHPEIDRQDFVLQWITTIVALRLPAVLPVNAPATLQTIDRSSGWIGAFTYHQVRTGDTTYVGLQVDSLSISSYASYSGSFDAISWLPDEALAQAWVEQMVSNTNVDDSVWGSGLNQFNYQGNWSLCHNVIECGGPTGFLYNDTNSWSNTPNDTVTITFNGTAINLYGVQDTMQGIGAVSLDGGGETAIDFYAPARSGNVLLWVSPGLDSGVHTLTLRVTGNRNVSSSDSYIALDRVEIFA